MSVDTIFKINISKMTTDDVEEVVKLEEEAYGEHHWAKSSFYDEMNNSIARYYCARTLDGLLVAYAGVWNIIDETHITTIAVSPEYKRRHIGEALIVKILEDCYVSKIKYLTLEVRESNIPAINLYKKYGFSDLGTRKGYYQDNNESALIMWTENIFYDKFKTQFEQNRNNLKEYIEIR